MRKKISQSRNYAQKILVECETRTHVLLLGKPQKNPIQPLCEVAVEVTLLWQLVEASL